MSALCVLLKTSVVICVLHSVTGLQLPIVINTWNVPNATRAAWETVSVPSKTAVDAVEAGCSQCEAVQCRGAVGYGGSPDEQGETTLDAMIMDGKTHDVGAVGALRNVKTAISVARAVMEYTEHTFLVGDQATDFALMMGFQKSDLHSNRSIEEWKQWRSNNCQPNFRQNVTPDPTKSCGPYSPNRIQHPAQKDRKNCNKNKVGISPTNHDTIGMVVVDGVGNAACGTSTNGLTYKVPGRVGDSPIAGAGSYVDNNVGGAAATGNGDIMMRFLPSFYIVNLMSRGVSPTVATEAAIQDIVKFYPDFFGAVIAVNVLGEFAAACHGYTEFPYCVRHPNMTDVSILTVKCS